jgi:hypothetical protein
MHGIDRIVGEPTFFRMDFTVEIINAQLLLESMAVIAELNWCEDTFYP